MGLPHSAVASIHLHRLSAASCWGRFSRAEPQQQPSGAGERVPSRHGAQGGLYEPPVGRTQGRLCVRGAILARPEAAALARRPLKPSPPPRPCGGWLQGVQSLALLLPSPPITFPVAVGSGEEQP